MWPQGTNCSFLTGLSDYFQDIQKSQSSYLTENAQNEINTICDSLNRLILNHGEGKKRKSTPGGTNSYLYSTPMGDEKQMDNNYADDEYSIEKKVKKFFEWSQTYISMDYDTDNGSVNWQQLVELFNFHFPQFAIPPEVDVTTFHASYLTKYCKEKGNELMKDKKIKNAIEMYSKAIELLVKEKVKNVEKTQQQQQQQQMNAGNGHLKEKQKDKEKIKSSKNEIAIIYCNRSAAYVYLQEYQKAVDDAVFALKNDPLLTKAWIRKGMAEQELKRYQIAYGDYQVALNQSKQTDNYYKFLIKKIKQCFDQILIQHTGNMNDEQSQQPISPHANNVHSPHSHAHD